MSHGCLLCVCVCEGCPYTKEYEEIDVAALTKPDDPNKIYTLDDDDDDVPEDLMGKGSAPPNTTFLGVDEKNMNVMKMGILKMRLYLNSPTNRGHSLWQMLVYPIQVVHSSLLLCLTTRVN